MGVIGISAFVDPGKVYNKLLILLYMGIRVSDKGVKEKLTLTQLILIYLSNKGCLTLEELEEYTNAKREVLLVTLTRMYKKGLIYRKWRKFGGKKYREYCLKYRDEILH